MRKRLLATSVLCGALCGLAGGSAFAQAASTASKEAAAQDPANQIEEIVVTGSLIRRTDTETPSPVTVLTSESLARAGITTAADAIRSVSADGAGSIGTSFTGGFSAGGSAVSLRGLGVSSTLVLVDGLRSANFPLNDDGHNAYVDLNSIPFSLIERIEVLKDGASSSYGADAIGGVVNLKLRKQFVGVRGSLEAGRSDRGDAEHERGDITLGFGDYAESGWNVYVNAEYQGTGRVTTHSRGFPYNTTDLTSIGGLDLNTADSNLTTATPNAVVVRMGQRDLNDPRTGTGTPLSNQYSSLNLNCANGTFTVSSGSAQGVGCKWNLADTYGQIQPAQKRYAFNSRLSVRLSDQIEGYATGSYSVSEVNVKNGPRSIRNTQPFGASPTQSGLLTVLPVWVCNAGVNCASAPDRRLNPNNPFASAYANDPANGAARIYYLFGDIKAGSQRVNEVIRGSAGLKGSFGDGWNWTVDAVGARDNLRLEQYGFLNISNLMNAINTGAYNFVDPSKNSDAVRRFIAPDITTHSHSSMMSLDAAVTKSLWALPGGDLQAALGVQARKEVLENNNQNARLDTYGLTTSSAFGKHTVKAGFFEIAAPVLDQLEINISGRYDDYSEGFSHFSPKVGVKYKPIRQLALRGTYSEGFRAPTFAESGPRSQYAGFSTYTPPASFQNAHGGVVSGGNSNPYAAAYSLGSGVVGNPDLKPETSKSFTLGVIAQPTPWLSMTVDYYNVKKSNLVVSGSKLSDARAAYYTKTNVADACAAVAAVGPGYSCNVIDAPDPLFPAALPRVLIINVPFENADYSTTAGVDFSATANVHLPYDAQWTSRVEVTHVLKYNLYADGDVQKYAGTLGPYELSSGNGTPSWRGNWQNTVSWDRYTLSATAYYVGKIKSVAADDYGSNECVAGNPYANGNTDIATRFCHVKRFVNIDLNGTAKLNDGVQVYATVSNLFDKKAPIAPASYSASNALNTWHYAGLIGRAFRVGVRFEY